jgi:XTP/dITP diphosphohydrolase/tetrapyrrole methylase family protein/MazG family protein
MENVVQPPASAFEDFVAIVRRLRKECPWDREQTHTSIRDAMIEEAYEVVDAIDAGDLAALKLELGDVILNAVFHAILAEENSAFTIDDVLRAESEKLIARHPHVFGDVEAPDTQTVLQNWEEIKRKEGGRTSALDGVPSGLPALQYAHRMQSKAARVGFDFESAETAWEKVAEEVGELERVRNTDDAEFEAELGDLLFAIVNYARLRGFKAEASLRRTNHKFASRFRFIEERLEASGRSLKTATLEEMDELWEEAKGREDR